MLLRTVIIKLSYIFLPATVSNATNIQKDFIINHM